ncbi:hypothetical protein [Aquimarina sp. SS2-1]|uniref:hypothetical protein n=1 Tax=Aquimarina besae TaxID=3342247 RepID=UPI00366AF127
MENYKILLAVSLILLLGSCESDDDNNCPDIIEIVTEEDLELAERCGLDPAPPLGKYWVSKNYKKTLEVQ